MNPVLEWWARGEVLAFDCLFRADGTAREADFDGSEHLRLELGEPVDVAELAAGPPWDAGSAGINSETELPDGRGYLLCGDGGLGHLGFIGRLGPDRELVWLLTTSTGNPFVRATVDWPLATFVNDWGTAVTLDLTDPDFAAP
ncbi:MULTISPECIES: hypothetical protein [Kitasatospora]|uniref:SMI1/KNR4 family protein n=1 Tax=Kitasatospora cathayae TaxID=3004092 RepID=A0ABY7QCR9_9ACTN|nr:hypothetical protein [Kitasatospora sp. HUAS 3-15]WBP90387.1 hypothetical protein O1G21_34035 [Kitasatospora sp. HUAS 3-15]